MLTKTITQRELINNYLLLVKTGCVNDSLFLFCEIHDAPFNRAQIRGMIARAKQKASIRLRKRLTEINY